MNVIRYAHSAPGLDGIKPVLASGAVVRYDYLDPLPDGSVFLALEIGHPEAVVDIQALPGVTLLPKDLSAPVSVGPLLSHFGLTGTTTMRALLMAAGSKQYNHRFDPKLFG